MARFAVNLRLIDCYRYFSILHALLLALLVGFGLSLYGQQLPVGTAIDQQGEQPFLSYHGGDIDSIGLTNGTLSLNFPFLTYPQRGKLHLSFNLMYNNEPEHYAEKCEIINNQQFCQWIWGYDPVVYPLPLERGDAFVGWAQQMGIAYQGTNSKSGQTTFYYTNYSLLMADGTKHVLGNRGNTSFYNDGQGDSFLISGGPLQALDASGWQLQGSQQANALPYGGALLTGGAIDTDGVQYGTTGEDSNGNEITSSATAITDSIGRQVSFPPTNKSAGNISTSNCPSVGTISAASAVSWVVPAYNGTAQYIFCYANININIPTTNNGVDIIGETTTVSKLQSIVLPNGQSWQFQYDDTDNTQYNGEQTNWGTLTQITLPTGGSISYTYETMGASAGPCQTSGRWVATRTVTDETGQHKWQYTYNSGNTVVTDPELNDVVHTFGYVAGCAQYETATQYYQGGHTPGTLLKTVNTTYSQGDANSQNTFPNGATNVVPIKVAMVWPNGQTSSTSMTYDAGFSYYDYLGHSTDRNGSANAGIYGKKISQGDTDFGGALLRTTTTSYVWQGNSTYLTNNLLNLPSQISVFAGAATSGACNVNGAVACTTYGYDETTPGSSKITEQHNSNPPDGSSRGNQTSIHRWLNTTKTSIVSTKQYFDTGMVSMSVDPLNNQTTYAYSAPSPNYGAYLTTLTNALLQNTTYGYDANTGLLTSDIDLNNQQTTYTYDSMRRIGTITYPTGGGTLTHTYDDTVGQLSVNLVHTMSSTQSTNEYILFDGLGREIADSKQNGESTPWDKTDTCYNAVGLKSFTSYPYQASAYNAAQVCSGAGDAYTYDALKRTTEVQHSDGTSILTSYGNPGGRATDVSDEGAGNPNNRIEKVSQVDGLGRLVSVCEVSTNSNPAVGLAPAACSQDIAKTGFLTNYSYDVLGNLTKVTQGALAARTFTHDSLSRLLTASNPESGLTCFGTMGSGACQNNGYDADGNVITRTRPAPNQTGSSTVTTTYTYDALNRLTAKTYSDGVTPNVLFAYDQTSGTMGSGGPKFTSSNSIGRLSWECTGSASTCTSSAANMNAFAYDSMGRTTQFWECQALNCGASGNIVYSYNYDYIGDETGYQVGSGPDGSTQIGETYNIAGRLTNFTALTYIDPTNPQNIYTGIVHDAFGHIVSASLANGLSDSWGYDARGRVNARAIGTGCSSGNCSVNDYRFTINYTGNGDVLSSTDTVNGSWTHAFDDLNRLTSAISSGTGQGCSWDIDSYGNRWHQNANSGTCTTPSFSFTGGNNRIDTYSYDSAGNLLNDGFHTYTYDAENRIATVDGGASSYIYDAEGRRFGKTVGGLLTTYLYDRLGRETLQSNFGPGEVYAGGLHIGTYIVNSQHTDTIFYYDHADWLGTERARFDLSGNLCETITNLPYGDSQVTAGACSDVSPMHFTGKLRDTESNLDNFDARMYSSNLGRFMTADWSATPEAVPYAKLGAPQTLNLYAYVGNNPVTAVDLDGHNENTAGNPGSPGCNESTTAGCATDKQGGTQSSDSFLGMLSQELSDTFWGMADALAGKQVGPGTEGEKESASVDGMLVAGMSTEAGAAGRAVELAETLGKTKDFVTIAVTETKEGISVVSSSESALRPAVRAALKEGEVAAKGAGHAEVTGVRVARNMGLTPTGVAASRGICPSCAQFLRDVGVAALTALKTVKF